MNFLAERQEEEPAQYHYSKNIARKQFLKDNKEMKKKDLNKLKKEFILIFDAFKNNKLITEGFYARHKGRRADNMNGVNASVALKKIIEDNSPAMKDRILEKVAEKNINYIFIPFKHSMIFRACSFYFFLIFFCKYLVINFTFVLFCEEYIKRCSVNL